MGKPVVFVDTNCIDNMSSATAFLGNREDIEKIAKRAKIILPQVVFDELSKHIRTFLGAQLDKLKRNPHRYHLGIKDEQIESLDLDQLFKDLLAGEAIPYEVLDLIDKPAAYDAAYQHAIEGTPPFEPKGDKGFKDTLIAKTIDEYVSQETGETIFLMAKDGRLTEYFVNNDKVSVICNYSDFDQVYNEDKIDEYLIERIINFINEQDSLGIKKLSLKDKWINWNNDLVGYFEDRWGIKYYVIIDTKTREPISYSIDSIEDVLNDLSTTSNFRAAHENMARLSKTLDYLDEAASLRAFSALLNNDQIYSICTDFDIQQVASNFSSLLAGFSLHDEAKTLRGLYGLTSPQDIKKLLEEIPF